MIYVEKNIFHLTDGKFSYAFFVRDGKLIHSYYGKALPQVKGADSGIDDPDEVYGAPDSMPVEYGEQGRCDFRINSVVVRGEGIASTDLRFVSYEVLKNKPSIGMPALRGEAETLKIVLRDELAGVECELYYSVYDGGLARHARIKNIGKGAIALYSLDSLCVDFPTGDYDLLTLDGKWGQEARINRRAAAGGVTSVGSKRGVSSHRHNPFAAVLERTTTEESGDAFGFNLIYSGNHRIAVERDEHNQLRFCMGLWIQEGGITLGAGETFVSPEAVSVYSDCGLGGMSRLFHRLYRARLIDPRFADKPRPIVVNSWESVYFGFDEKKLVEFINGAKGLGIDTVVLDDGWFGKRDSDNCSLGDWVIDRNKLPNGLTPLIDCCKRNGMKFGIWFEPESINPDSDLYRAHPDWAIHTEGRVGMQMRNQFVLDFSKKEVVDYIYESMCKILSADDISYVKWDMNRPLSDVPDAKLYIGFVAGMYELYERLTKKYPDILIEGCSSGGGRFDPAILYYSPMIWSSDDTDAYQRTYIQYGLSMCYPLQTMSNHVSACPCHQTQRTTPFDTRGAVASLGSLGYELNVAKITDAEREKIRQQTAAYKLDRELVLKGDLYRLRSPYEDGAFCEQLVSADKSKSYLVYVLGMTEPIMPQKKLRLRGLDPDALYLIKERSITRTGAELMYRGINPKVSEDFTSLTLHIERVK